MKKFIWEKAVIAFQLTIALSVTYSEQLNDYEEEAEIWLSGI